MYQLEKVTDPTIYQGLLNSCCGVTGTKLFIAYMGMGYTVVASCRMGIQGYNGIHAVVSHFCQAGDVQLDIEFTQVHTLKLNRFGCDH